MLWLVLLVVGFVAASAGLFALAGRLVSRRRERIRCVEQGVCPNCGSETLRVDHRYSGFLFRGVPTRKCTECYAMYDVPSEMTRRRVREALARKLEQRVAQAIKEDHDGRRH